VTMAISSNVSKEDFLPLLGMQGIAGPQGIIMHEHIRSGQLFMAVQHEIQASIAFFCLHVVGLLAFCNTIGREFEFFRSVLPAFATNDDPPVWWNFVEAM